MSCLFLNKGAKLMLIFLSFFCPLHAFSHEGIEQGTVVAVKDQRNRFSTHKGPFGEPERAAALLWWRSHGPPRLKPNHKMLRKVYQGHAAVPDPQKDPKKKSLLLSICVTLEYYFAVMLWLWLFYFYLEEIIFHVAKCPRHKTMIHVHHWILNYVNT